VVWFVRVVDVKLLLLLLLLVVIGVGSFEI
jgi:hypothetical protein